MKLLYSITHRKNAVPHYFIIFFFLIFVAILYAVDFRSILQQGCRKYQQLEYSTQKESKSVIESEEEPGLTPIRGEETKLFDKIIVEPTILAQDEEAKSFDEVIAKPTATEGKEAKSLERGEEIKPAQTRGEEAKSSHEGDAVESAEEKDLGVPFAVGRMEEGCDVFSGKWVYDEARPHYREQECRFISSQFTCQAHGRPDRLYQHWRWQPHGCSLPSFDAKFMLERLRGKRMLFVGDSLNRGQYTSMLCLLQHATPKFSKSHRHHASHTVFSAPEYNASFEFYWAPFLVESNCDNASVHRVTDRVVHEYMGSLERHAQYWKGVDIMVFNTYAWWNTGTKMKIMRRYRGRKYIRLMRTEDGYQLVLKSMVSWLEKNMDPHKTRIFFMSMSPTHFRSMDWGGDLHGSCYGETTPIFDPTYWGSGASKSIMQVVREVLGDSKVPITVVNITQLSLYRKDAHTSAYKELRYTLTPEQLANPRSYADCNHWCLPGLQDTWNELLYTKLFFIVRGGQRGHPNIIAWKIKSRSTEWEGKLGGSCHGETTPIFDPTYWSSASSKRMMQVAGEVLGSSKVPITILNITQLSAYRKDAHTSIYKKQPYNLTQEQPANPIPYADCNHWCLPGVQDAWNELFYAKLFFP